MKRVRLHTVSYLAGGNPGTVGGHEPQIARLPDLQAATALQSRSSCRTSDDACQPTAHLPDIVAPV